MYQEQEPFGYRVENWRMGIVSSVIANFSGRARRRLKPADFMPKDPEPDQASFVDRIKAHFRSLTHGANPR